MLFNSIEFFIFYLIVFCLYWLIKSKTVQNILILVSSYYFYGSWDWRFLSLIFISSCIDYYTGRKIYLSKRKNAWLIVSLFSNLGILGFFKYFNFFTESFVRLVNQFGFSASFSTLSIILPVGISFYTFQTLSYSIDIFKGKVIPNKSFIEFLAFVSFFPQLVAGPIERARDLLPQFSRERTFSYNIASKGVKLIMWGFFKKLVIADNAAGFVNFVFENSGELGFVLHWLGIVAFAFQIYCDFSGYSDIAIGLAGLLGFSLSRNFNYPYFSENISNFWKRWHISLSSWFRDYVYIPLGGNRNGRGKWIKNILLTFCISGFWHGASWNFIVWGLLHGLYYLPWNLLRNKFLIKLPVFLSMIGTFIIVCIAWVFFRQTDLLKALNFSYSLFQVSDLLDLMKGVGLEVLKYQLIKNKTFFVMLMLFVLIEYLSRNSETIFLFNSKLKPIRLLAFLFVFQVILLFGKFELVEFIYFQF